MEKKGSKTPKNKTAPVRLPSFAKNKGNPTKGGKIFGNKRSGQIRNVRSL